MPKKKKKNRKSKVQKKSECSSSVGTGGSLLGKKADFHKFTQKFINLMSKKSDASSESEIKEEFEKYYGICTLAWNLSLTGGTYEKSIEELNSLALKDNNLLARMSMKFALIHALRMLFSLPADEESTFQAAVDILTSEELDCFYKNIDLNGLENN